MKFVKSKRSVNCTDSRFWKCNIYMLSLWPASMFNNCLRSGTYSQDQNAGQSHSIKIDNSTFEMVEEFKYLGRTLTNQNSVQEEIKKRVKSGNAYYHLVQALCLPVCYPKI